MFTTLLPATLLVGGALLLGGCATVQFRSLEIAEVAYAKVNLNVVDVQTSEVILSAQGAGEYSLDSREVIGFGGTSSYDSILNGKVLDLAMREAVNRLVDGIHSGAWQPGRWPNRVITCSPLAGWSKPSARTA